MKDSNNTLEEIIEHTVLKEKEGTYYKIPFEVEDNIDTVYVSYEYPEGVIDIGLADEDQYLGWSGSNKKTISIGNNPEAGYLKTNLKKGTYYIIVGAYKIPNEDGIKVNYTIEQVKKSPRWLSGDLHMHTNASDGQYDVYSLAVKAKKIGLDFIAITNHNNFSENFFLPNIPGITIIPGVEWTHYKGHMNFFGLKEPFKDFALSTQEEMDELINDVRTKGGIISVNHPKDNGTPYIWNSENYDLFEVWNGPMRPSNVRALELWHQKLIEGKRIPIIGGSDYHKSMHPVMLGHPTTRVYAQSNTQNDILKAILEGNCYVTSSPSGPAIFQSYNKVNNELSIEVTNTKGCHVELINQNGVVEKFKGKRTFKVQGDWKFAYVIVKALRIKAISNPIYFD